MEAKEQVEFWGLVELFGHQQIAGYVSSAEIGGCHFLRVDVPEVGGRPGFTKYYGNGAIYALHPTSEEIARKAAERIAATNGAPLPVYLPDLSDAHRTIEEADRLRREAAAGLKAITAGSSDRDIESAEDDGWDEDDDLEF